MRGHHPETCAWLSEAVALLDRVSRWASSLIPGEDRGLDARPVAREALSVTAWVSTRHTEELEGRIGELFGALKPPSPELLTWFEDQVGADLGALAGAVSVVKELWRQAQDHLDAHTGLLLRLQLAQLDEVVSPMLRAACRAVGTTPSPPSRPVPGRLNPASKGGSAHPSDFLDGL